MSTADPSCPLPCRGTAGIPRAARRNAPAILLFLAGLLLSDISVAQTFGRWWWTAEAGARQNISRLALTNAATSETKQTALGLSGSINGFILHPAVGSFNANLDLLFRQSSGSSELDTDRVGYGAEVGLFQQGVTPTQLFAGRRNYDYTSSNGDEFVSSLTLPAFETRWGGNTGVRRGALRGFNFQFDRLSFENENGTGQSNERQIVTWSRNFGDFRSNFRLKRVARDFGALGSGFNDITAEVSESATLSPTWNWSFTGTAIQREIFSVDQSTFTFDNTRLTTSLSHQMRRYDLLTFRAFGGFVSPSNQSSTRHYRSSVSYRWTPRPVWHITPFVDYLTISEDNHSVRSPRLNLMVAWNPRAGTLDASLSATGRYGWVNSDNEVETSDQTETGYTVAGSLAQGSRSRLRKEFSAQISRNQLRLTSDPVLDLPDLDLIRAGFRRQDFGRARFGLDKGMETFSMSGYVNWIRTRSSGNLDSRNFQSDALLATLGFNARKVRLRSNLGQTEATAEGFDPQIVRFASVQAFWKPLRYLDVRANYRKNLRLLSFSPNLDGEQYGAGATLRVGLIDVNFVFLQLRNQLDEQSESVRTTISWSISRRFAGWLPIVTGTRRAGVIR